MGWMGGKKGDERGRDGKERGGEEAGTECHVYSLSLRYLSAM